MKSFWTKALLAVAGATGAVTFAHAQQGAVYRPSLLPMPPAQYRVNQYPAVQPVALNRWYQNEGPELAEPAPSAADDVAPSPSDMPTGVPQNAPSYAPSPSYSYPSYAPQHAAPGCATCQDGGYSAMQGYGYGQGSYGGCSSGACGASDDVWCGDSGCCAATCGWYGNVGGLIMTRDNDERRWLSYDTGNFANVLMSDRDAAMPWSGGFEARLGRYFNCGQNAVEMIYWGLFPNTQEAIAWDPDEVLASGNDLGSVLDFRTLDVLGGPVLDWYNGAVGHRLVRTYEFHNIEANLLGGPCGWSAPCDPCSTGLRLNWTAGVRYFRYREGFRFEASELNETFAHEADDIGYEIGVTNNLIGFQLGGRADYCASSCLKLHAATKLGIYGNHVTHHSCIGTATDYATVVDPGQANDGAVWNIRTSKTDAAFLGEIDLGFQYQLTCHWSLYGGYRAVAITGLATALDQIPHDFADIHGVEEVDSNSSMILHGAYAGAMFTY